jgi:hypothetical protein
MAERVAEGHGAYDGSLDEGCEYAIQRAGQSSGWGEEGLIHAVQQIFHAYWEDPHSVELKASNEEREAESRWQADVVRCVFGNPFHKESLDPSWLAWNDGTVVKLAQGIYDEQAFDRLPILADALEEAGCANADILGHCRQPGPHVRGCWVVDLVLGKN